MIESVIAGQACGIIVVVNVWVINGIIFLVTHQILLLLQRVRTVHIKCVAIKTCNHLTVATTVIFVHITQLAGMIVGIFHIGPGRSASSGRVLALHRLLLVGRLLLGRDKIHVVILSIYGKRQCQNCHQENHFTCHIHSFLINYAQN
jgi:hypothetical protein